MISELRSLLATAPTARDVFDPTAAARPVNAVVVAGSGPAPLWRLFLSYYMDRLARRALIVCALVLAYGGGAVMFWVHAVYLGEQGPAISPYLHWALDSTAGFIGLAPPLAVILPFAAAVAGLADPTAGARPGPRRVSLPVITVVGGAAFALVTVAGPIAHDTFIARGTWIADRLTVLAGNPGAVGTSAAPDHVSHAASMGAQFVVGLPTYTALFGLTLILIRAAVRTHRRTTRTRQRRAGVTVR
jgi:hypothetical protein